MDGGFISWIIINALITLGVFGGVAVGRWSQRKEIKDALSSVAPKIDERLTKISEELHRLHDQVADLTLMLDDAIRDRLTREKPPELEDE